MRLERDLPNADVMEPQMPHNKRREKNRGPRPARNNEAIRETIMSTCDADWHTHTPSVFS